MADKKAFEFRMSKKVAELTEVVHMLFTRNHEREVEIELLKDAYENEIDEVIIDAKSRILTLKNTIAEVERHKAEEAKTVKASCDAMLKQKEEEWEKMLETKEKSLQHEKKECQKLRDMLIDAQKDIEKLRQGVDVQLTNQNEELANKIKEIDKLRKIINMHEKKLKESEQKTEDMMKDLEEDNANMGLEIDQLKELLESTTVAKEQVVIRNKQLEADMKMLKKDLTRRFSEMANTQKMVQFEQKPKQSSYLEYNDELERLRREVQRYRMELTNREGNFNRMFTDKKPIVVDNKAGKIAMHQQFFSQNCPQVNTAGITSHFKRERTISYAITQGYDASHDDVPIRSTSSMSRLPPMLTMDTKARLSRLVKPRPLPKEMLSGK